MSDLPSREDAANLPVRAVYFEFEDTDPPEVLVDAESFAAMQAISDAYAEGRLVDRVSVQAARADLEAGLADVEAGRVVPGFRR